jgi:hypothetical protein
VRSSSDSRRSQAASEVQLPGRLSPTARNHYRRDQQLPEVRQLRALLRHRVALVWRRTRLCIRNHAIVADMVMTGRAAGTGAARAGPGPPGGAGYFSRAARQRRAGLGIEDAGCGLAAVVPGDSPRRDAAAQVGDGRQQARAGHGLAGVGGAQSPGVSGLRCSIQYRQLAVM